MRSWPLQLPIAAILAFSCATSAFYLPGVAPTSYGKGTPVPLNVNRLTPSESETDAQLHNVISYDYYHREFQFCQPADAPKYVSESLGSILFGDRIMSSPFELKMLENETCKALCETQHFDEGNAKFVNDRIRQRYNLNWLVDALPAGMPYTDLTTNTDFFQRGFPLGQVDQAGQAYLNNHYDIVIDYHEAGQNQYRVVGVMVISSSRADNKNLGDGHDAKAECGYPEGTQKVQLNEQGNTDVTWTYGVYWRPSKTAWATRWDPYLHVYDPKIHWFSLVNSAIIVVFLVGMVAAILMRALKKDIARYNRLESFNLDDLSGADGNAEDGIQEDSGWKLVHGDVFRTPNKPLLLSVFLGNGSQLFVITGTTIIFALFGFLSPSNRGSLGTIMILLWTIFGFVGGYVSARTYKTFGGESWKQNIALTPVLVPGIAFAMFFLLNFFLWIKGSSGAVPFTTMLVILGIWFIISLPLSFAGSWMGFKHAVSHSLHSPFVTDSNLSSLSNLLFASTRSLVKSPLNKLPAPLPLDGPRWHPPLRRHLRRALFHPQQHLVRQGLLHVRLPLPLLPDHDPHLRRRHHPPRLFPSLRRELPLAMARVSVRWR